MDLDRLLERALAIQSIPAPTFSEAARAAWVHHEFEKIDATMVDQDPIGNVYFHIPGGGGSPVVVTAHLDTVFPLDVPLSCQHTSERIIGPGIGDNSIGVAALLEIASDYSGTSPPGDIWLVANVGEEGLGNLVGMLHVIRRFEHRPNAYIVIEGMALGHIYHSGLPVRRYRIEAKGAGGHAWIHDQRPSALHSLIEFAGILLKLDMPRSPKTTLNLGTLHGGSTVNSIASKAFLELDLRSEKQSILDGLSNRIETLVRDWEVAGISLKSTKIGDRPGGSIPESHPLVTAAINSHNDAGITQVLLEAGSTDASAPLNHGYPAVCVGLTRGGNAHSSEEFIEIAPIRPGYRSLLNLIERAMHLD